MCDTFYMYFYHDIMCKMAISTCLFFFLVFWVLQSECNPSIEAKHIGYTQGLEYLSTEGYNFPSRVSCKCNVKWYAF